MKHWRTWQILLNKHKLLEKLVPDFHMSGSESDRQDQFTFRQSGLTIDISRNLIDQDIFIDLIELAKEAHIKEKIHELWTGKNINFTEQRPALHTALRAPLEPAIYIDEFNVSAPIHQVLSQMEEFCYKIHDGVIRGVGNEAFTDVVSLGIGGSFLGPKMVSEALHSYHKNHLNVHFVANVDAHHIQDVLKSLNPTTTLFVVASKSFTTSETLQNFKVVRQWYEQQGYTLADLQNHWCAITSEVALTEQYGIRSDRVFPIWDWVGGRYSLWSAIGLPIALAIGFNNFQRLLEGAYSMDRHFFTADLKTNLPVILAVLGIWYINAWNMQSQAIIPYHHYLRGLPTYIQQLDMESNGKSVNQQQQIIGYNTSPIIWGTEGTNGQHAYHQLLLQGKVNVPVDLIAVLKPDHLHNESHIKLLANYFAQSEALWSGVNTEQIKSQLKTTNLSSEDINKLAKHKIISGKKPHNLIMLDDLTPHTLGALIALYEHKVTVQGFMWGINSFDQYGVELGKNIANEFSSRLPVHDIIAKEWSYESIRQHLKR